FGFLPEPMGDSIFAVWAEETGLIGSLIIVSLFLFFAWRGFKIIKNTSDGFARLTAIGIVFWIVSQAFVNIGAMIGVLPLTGIPLPFISFGGSALISVLIGTGILLNISKYANEP
ncbi:MAG: FtsW/RodA/SpoVE family cell cycle protein, partial [Candidatus Pacebacteria bacterium]|nr:FtsW/RodA/SpoVE family cell cycle protein [Candidatus Paceibacterota bacterium]